MATFFKVTYSSIIYYIASSSYYLLDYSFKRKRSIDLANMPERETGSLCFFFLVLDFFKGYLWGDLGVVGVIGSSFYSYLSDLLLGESKGDFYLFFLGMIFIILDFLLFLRSFLSLSASTCASAFYYSSSLSLLSSAFSRS